MYLPAAAQPSEPRPVAVETSPITHFRFGSDQTRFGELEYIGGFTISAEDREFGQLSALRFLTPGRDLVGVADHGYFYFATIRRDDAGRPSGIADVVMHPMLDGSGRAIGEKELVDAEGLDVRDGIATVAFEREARLSEFAIDSAGMGPPSADIDFVVPRRELRFNQGLETVTRAPEGGSLDGARVVVSERSIDADGDIFAAIVEGSGKGVFKVRRRDGFDVTDGAFLPDGDLLLLERRFSVTYGVAMRLRRIAGDALRPGALVDGEVLMEADLAYQIDNMEGLDVWRREDGTTIVSLLSDDNQSFLQRTLYLEFELVD
jgi:hypothetical protein